VGDRDGVCFLILSRGQGRLSSKQTAGTFGQRGTSRPTELLPRQDLLGLPEERKTEVIQLL
jgi:hypothetical protein